MDSQQYWKEREREQLRHNVTDEAEYARHIQEIYEYMMDQIQKEISGFYARYAGKEGISIAEAKKRAAKLDIDAYSRKAKRYVRDKDFSAQANAEMRLYNLTMKVNRLELLKANIGLEMVSGFDELQGYFGQILTERALGEFERQAGILGKTVIDNAAAAHAIVNASFHNATFSDRIWVYQDMLKSELDSLLRVGLIQGRNPRELARHLERRFGVARSNAERLMVTELARVQTEAQRQSFKRNGFTEYTFLALGDACGECARLDGMHFKVRDMMPGTNAPPMHPRCRCSTAAYMDDREYEEWLEGASEHGLSYDEWKEKYGIGRGKNLAKPINSMYNISEEGKETFKRQEIIDEMGRSKIGQKVLNWIENADAKILIKEDEYGDGNRGDQEGKFINLYPRNIKSIRVAAQTVIHEMGHYHYGIGNCQHAEAICFGLEKLHLTGKERLTKDEWEYVKKLAIDNYPEYEWEEGGYGNFEEIKIIETD